MLVERRSFRNDKLNPEKQLSATNWSHDTPSPPTAINHAAVMQISMGWWRLWQASRSWGLQSSPLAEFGCQPRHAATQLTSLSPGFQTKAHHPVSSGRCWSNSSKCVLPASCGCGAQVALSVPWPTLSGVTAPGRPAAWCRTLAVAAATSSGTQRSSVSPPPPLPASAGGGAGRPLFVCVVGAGPAGLYTVDRVRSCRPG
jgi:hypothetical protein